MLHPGTAAAWIALFALTSATAACSNSSGDRDGGIVVTDGVGRTVRLDAPARRVVSTLPSLTEWVIELGAADRLVARTDYDDHPAVIGLPSVGGGLDPSVEWLAARRPDLVLAWPDARSRSLVTRLEALGIPAYTAPIHTIEEALAAAEDVGRLLALDSAAARATDRVRRGLDDVARSVAGRPRPSVLFLIGIAPLTAAGPGTFIHELLEVAGGSNAVADIPILWPNLSLEEVVRRAPDIVILAGRGAGDPAAELRTLPGWRNVPAVRSGRVHAIDANVMHRPGPRLDRTAVELARLIHGTDR